MMWWWLMGCGQQLERLEPSPDGRFEARVHTFVIDGYVPAMPGAASDRRAEVVRRADGVSLGRIPVDMLQLVALEWGEDRVAMSAIGEWDLVTGACSRWVDDRLVSCR